MLYVPWHSRLSHYIVIDNADLIPIHLDIWVAENVFVEDFFQQLTLWNDAEY